MEVRRAVATNNYHRFFVLYDTAPSHGRYLLDLLTHRCRTRALQTMADA
jgi:hypothetical protein